MCRYVHVLGDAYPILTDSCLGLSSEYPWAMTIATAASLFTFTLEWVLHKTFHKRLILQDQRGVQAGKAHDAEAPLPAGPTGDMVNSADHKVRLWALQNVVISYTFEAGIIFHSESLCCAVNFLHWVQSGSVCPVLSWTPCTLELFVGLLVDLLLC